MYQVSIAVGKSSGSDVSFLRVPAATVLAAGRMALLIGESTGLTSGQLIKHLQDCITALGAECRQSGGLKKAQMAPATLGPPAIAISANAALSSEVDLAAVNNATGNFDGQTTFIMSGLQQCWEVARETINAGGAPPIVP